MHAVVFIQVSLLIHTHIHTYTPTTVSTCLFVEPGGDGMLYPHKLSVCDISGMYTEIQNTPHK